jgi:protein O-mannosyl-transferase
MRRVTALTIAALTLVVFLPTLGNGFVHWDDPVLYLENAHYRGLGGTQVAWMFTTTLMGHYVPVTWLTLGSDYLVWGMRPIGYHLTSLVWHAATAALFYLVALRLIGAATRLSQPALRVAAAASALAFAIHPLRVESVVWITERRDVVSGLFFMLTVLLYLRAVDRHVVGRGREWPWHAAACATYALAVFSKSIVMTLPAILVLLDVYPLRRLELDWRTWARPSAALAWREKIPYAVLGAVAAIVGYWAQATGTTFTSLESLRPAARPLIAVHSVWFHLVKTLVPLDLSPLYEPPPHIAALAPQFVVPVVGVGALSVVVLALRRRWPAGHAAWLAYVILLAPVSGLVHAGNQLTNDRYSYLATLPLALLAGAGAGWLVSRDATTRVRRELRLGLLGVSIAWLLALAVMSSLQTQAWSDDETLWRHAVESQPECSICLVNLGAALLRRDATGPAIASLERALEIRPDRVKAHLNLGVAFSRLGDLDRASVHLRAVLARQPDNAEALRLLATVHPAMASTMR